MRHASTVRPFLTALCVLLVPCVAGAQDPYKTPPPEIVKILDAAPLPSVSLSPDRGTMVLVTRVNLPPVADLARPMLRLAGSRINPATNGEHGPRRFTGFTIRKVGGERETPVTLPANADVSFPSWSPDGAHFAFTRTTEEGIELWVADAATGKARALTGPTLNECGGTPFRWMPDSRGLVCRFVPEGRGEAPKAPAAPKGPIVQETRGRTSPVRTYQDLLESPHDEAQYDYYFTAQLALIDVQSGRRTNLGAPGVAISADPSPDGRYLLVSRTVRPYSYLVPGGLFPEIVEVWDASGKPVRELTRMPLRDEIPIQGVQTGPRGYEWCDTADATLYWAEALDGGDPKRRVPHRDRVMRLAAPFTGEGTEVLKTEHRFSGLSWLENGASFVNEYDRDQRWVRTWLYSLQKADPAPRLVWDRSVQDRYNDPGRAVTTRTERGRSVVRIEGDAVYLSGQGATRDGDRPFLDRMTLADFSTERLWQCQGENLESVVDVLADDASTFLTSYETPDEPPNYYLRDRAKGTRTAVTSFPHPAPVLREIRKELVRYTRADGVNLSATMYLPPGYKAGTRLPMLVWAYPLEYNDPATAGQVSGSPYRFTMIGGSSHLFLLLQGYAVMDGATMPVIGEPETVNDTFIDQIVASAKAAIDKAAEMGVADPSRVAVGGHSYGAFMTANLLAHCDLFKTGIARSGAYNRSLTPFGFQGERRTYWEAVETYTRLSPFTYANQINEPVLLIHGMMDNNSGTFPIQSERLYHAIKGHGGTVRYVQLPFESHGYQARESVLHVVAEMVEWMDRHLATPSEGRDSMGR